MDRVIGRCGPTAEAARLRAAALRAQGEGEGATALLAQARSVHPDDPTAWTALALDAARRGDAADATSILDEARRRLGDRLEFRLAALQIDEADDTPNMSDLEKGLDGCAPEDRALLLCRLAEAYYRIGKMADGDRLCRRMAEAPATDLAGRVRLLETVLPSEDDGLVNGVLADVARLEGEDGAWAMYGRAARLTARAYRGDRGGLAEAKTLLDDLARRRPDWSRVALLQGRLAELDGASAAALDAYQRAFDLGERRPDVARPLVRMLAERGRWDEADQVMRRLQEQTVLTGALARQAAEVALQTHNGERAVELARQAAPAVDGYVYHVWLGRVLAAAGRPEEAEAELRRAVHFPDAGWDATAALAAQLARQGRPADAEAAVEAREGVAAAALRRLAAGGVLRGGGPARPGGARLRRGAGQAARRRPDAAARGGVPPAAESAGAGGGHVASPFRLRQGCIGRRPGVGAARAGDGPGGGRERRRGDGPAGRRTRRAGSRERPERRRGGSAGAGVRAGARGRKAGRRRCDGWKKSARPGRCRPTRSSVWRSCTKPTAAGRRRATGWRVSSRWTNRIRNTWQL